MALFKVNTGLREQELANLRWAWETAVSELETTALIIPRDFVKNGLDRYVVLKRIAKSVIENCRGGHPEFVFTRDGKPVAGINNSGWKAARRRAAKHYQHQLKNPCRAGFRSIRARDLKQHMVIGYAQPAWALRIENSCSAAN